MIKRIIFDLDNTLIMWKDEYEKAADIALNAINYPKTNDLYKKINEVESEYEEGKTKFDQKEVIDYLNEKLNLHLPYEFMDIWQENIGRIAVPTEYPKEDFKTLEYLSQKYELVVLTNWFIESQIKRLENIGICKFFTEFYGAEKYAKPYKESFEQAAGKFQMDEIAMVGDSLKMDIKGAIDAGIKNVVWRDIKNKAEEYKDELEGVYVIKELKQLKNVF